MIAKAIVKGQIINTNKYNIRIPIFENAGDSEILWEATVQCVGGSVPYYKEGDIVFVAFEDNRKSKPVILGKLWCDINTNNSSKNLSSVSDLEVNYSANLPENTTINGVKWKEVEGLFRQVYNNQSKLNSEALVIEVYTLDEIECMTKEEVLERIIPYFEDFGKTRNRIMFKCTKSDILFSLNLVSCNTNDEYWLFKGIYDDPMQSECYEIYWRISRDGVETFKKNLLETY